MTKEALIKKIKETAKSDEILRIDGRFLETMGFLVAKGFLKTNLNIPLTPNKRLRVDDVIWAGKNVEPRILEVLPAALLRLRKHFELQEEKHGELICVVEQLRKRQEDGDTFEGIPFKKLKIWADLPLWDQRVKTVSEKRIVKNFRFLPEVTDRLKRLAQEQESSETGVLEQLIMKA